MSKIPARRWARRIFTFIYALVLIEIALQGVSAWNAHQALTLDITGDYTILCVGDSFTYGIGAERGQSYPDHLQRILRERHPGKNIQVINSGIPGRNSSQCLFTIADHLQHSTPDLVLVMVGLNNCWNYANANFKMLLDGQPDNTVEIYLRMVDEFLCRSKLYKFIHLWFENPMDIIPVNQQNLKIDYPARSTEVANLLTTANDLLAAANYDAAEPFYRRALELSPDDYEPHWMLGRILCYQGKREQGRQEYLFAAQETPSLELVACILADMYDRRQPRTSTEFRDFTARIALLRPGWVAKFGEENVRRVIDPIVSDDQALAARILKNDLRTMAQLLAGRDSQLVILSYPLPATSFQIPENTYYQMAKELRVPFINNADYFNGLLQTYSAHDIFATDGHCNETGYRFLAQNIADHL